MTAGQFPSTQAGQEATLAAMTSDLPLPEHPWQSRRFPPFRLPGYGHLCPPIKYDISTTTTKMIQILKLKSGA